MFILAKCVFLIFNAEIYSGIGLSGVASIIGHGLSMDCATAAYFTALPALTLLVSACVSSPRALRGCRIALYVELGITALLAALAVAADTMLYPHWGFKLDTTPLFYLFSSPSAAAASGGVGGAVVLWLVLTLIYSAMLITWPALLPLAPLDTKRSKVRGAITMLLCTAALFIPIRGGFTVSTMNLSRAYFSSDTRLNHAAVNPIFSFLYSATHQDGFDSQFRYYNTDAEAQAILDQVSNTLRGDTIPAPRLATERPDIYLVILESFSSHLLKSLGGCDIAPRLDSVASRGMLFTQCYASSFRTDRALPAVLGGYPGQPTTSIMKFVEKTDRLPSLPRSLRDAGYDLSYYYGGDINFTSMNAYLVSAGFDRIVSDVDFPMSQRMSKWGAPDHALFDRMLADLRADTATAKPRFTVIQTSSSHEPFDVPYTSAHSDKRLNAFAYADHSFGNWIDSLAASPRWGRSLVVVVPDHFSVWPDTLTSQAARHHVPLVITGGALLNAPTRIDAVASQTDIAATLLGILSLPTDDFPFSRNLFDPATPRMAFFSDREHASIATADQVATVNITSETDDEGSPELLRAVRAYLQILYSDLQQR